MNIRDGAPVALQGRELQEARLAPLQIGGTRHAIGCLLCFIETRQLAEQSSAHPRIRGELSP
jgi:hypothetical protein